LDFYFLTMYVRIDYHHVHCEKIKIQSSRVSSLGPLVNSSR